MHITTSSTVCCILVKISTYTRKVLSSKIIKSANIVCPLLLNLQYNITSDNLLFVLLEILQTNGLLSAFWHFMGNRFSQEQLLVRTSFSMSLIYV